MEIQPQPEKKPPHQLQVTLTLDKPQEGSLS